MSHTDRYEQMTVRELLDAARHRPLSGRHRVKAQLIDELRRMDERRARGEPEGDYEHSQWAVGQAMEEFTARQQRTAVEQAVLRVQALLDQPGREPAYYEGVRDALGEVRNAPPPTDEQWEAYVDALATALEPLEWAGWNVPDEYGSDFDKVNGPVLDGRLIRTCMAIDVEYNCWTRELVLLCVEEPDAASLSMLDDDVTITLTGTPDWDRAAVSRTAGALGLLDPTVLKAGPDSSVSTADLLADLYVEWVFETAAAYRGLSVEELITEAADDEDLSRNLNWLAGFVAPNVVPDLIPGAAALGIAAWCWRNNTDVEAHHLPDDVLMARVNMAVTRAVAEHVDPYEGIDWPRIEAALASTQWALPDGRVIAELFADGWPDVERTVREQLRIWRRIDEMTLGPEATIRLLSVGGASSYTRHWWGQGRWGAIVEQIVTEAVAGGIALPRPYDVTGIETFLRDLEEPYLLSDEALRWIIDIPGASLDGPRGLRSHSTATAPVVRAFELWEISIPDSDELSQPADEPDEG